MAADGPFGTEVPCDSVEVMEMFRGLASRDPGHRSETCASIEQRLLLWADSGFLLPFAVHSSGRRQSAPGGGSGEPLGDEGDHVLPPQLQLEADGRCVAGSVAAGRNAYLLSVLRYSVQCPFDDVRQRCQRLFSLLQDKLHFVVPLHLLSGPSLFIPKDEIMPVSAANIDTKMLFTDTFLQNNRLDHLTHVMGFHPQYLGALLRTQNSLLRGDGPLPHHYRHYLAIIAAARHQCTYLIHIHKAEFLLCGGNRAWLESPTSVPEKLQSIQEINKLLAHRPWLINKGHIEKLTRGSCNWSMSELMHALVILAHFHALSTAVFGCGINGEIDAAAECLHCAPDSTIDVAAYTPQQQQQRAGSGCGVAEQQQQQQAALLLARQWPSVQQQQQSGCGSADRESPNFEMLSDDPVDNLLQKLRRLQEECHGDYSEEEVYMRFKHIESQSAELRPGDGSRPAQCLKCVAPFVIDADYCYVDFARCRSESDVQTLRASDYSWENHGYLIANRFYADVGTVLDDKFNIAKELTYRTMGDNCDVNTEAFRRGIWNYIHCIFGIMHDDYDYAEVNTLLQRNLKAYIKTITCYPERLTPKDFESVMKGFKYSEKIHVNIIVLEARMQAELLYALRAVAHYMT